MRRSLGSAVAAVLLVSACAQSSAPPKQPSATPPAPTASVFSSSTAPRSSSSTAAASSSSAQPGQRGRWDHVVVVVMENHSYRDIIGDPAAPFLSSLAGTGASFTASRGITHPSEPNYLGLFSGSTQGVTDDSCLPRLGADNLGHQLLAAGYTFVGYSEDLPRPGYRGCQNGLYATKHNPWVNFANLPDQVNQPMSAFPTDPNRLPTVSFVVPNVDNDMHDGSVGQGDTWLRTHLDQYAGWATAHRSLLLVTWDENDGSSGNDIPTIAVGSGVHGGRQADPITHYRVLRTLENAFGLNPLGAARATSGIAALGG